MTLSYMGNRSFVKFTFWARPLRGAISRLSNLSLLRSSEREALLEGRMGRH